MFDNGIGPVASTAAELYGIFEGDRNVGDESESLRLDLYGSSFIGHFSASIVSTAGQAKRLASIAGTWACWMGANSIAP